MTHINIRYILPLFCWFLFTTMAAEKAPETFIRTQSEPKELVAGQKILISIYLYTTQDVERVRQAGPELTLKGYNIERLTGGKVYYINRTQENGKLYNVFLLDQYAFLPEKPNKVLIPPMKYTIRVRKYEREADPFEEFFGYERPYKEQTMTLSSEKLTLTVREKPQRTTIEMQKSGNVI